MTPFTPTTLTDSFILPCAFMNISVFESIRPESYLFRNNISRSKSFPLIINMSDKFIKL